MKSVLKTDVFTLPELNLTIEDGEFISILGPSGCGKTTLIKLMSGLIKPDKGRILEDDKDKALTHCTKKPPVIKFNTITRGLCFFHF